MYAVGRIGNYITQGVYTVSGPFHPFGGAVDIIVVEQPDGSFKSSPWYVKFGKFQGVLKAREKVVNISVNGVGANFHMHLDRRGEAYFLREVEGVEGESVLYPSSSSDDTDGQSQKNRRPMKSKSCNYDGNELNSGDRMGATNGNIVARSNSRRSRILGLVFGRRSIKEDGYREGDDGASMVRISSLERAEIAANLLEVKWSTNFATSKPRTDDASKFAASDELDGKGDKDMPTNDGKGQVGSSMRDTIETTVDHCMLAEENGSCNVEMNNSSLSGFVRLECSVEEASPEMLSLGTMEQVVDTSTMSQNNLKDNCELISEISRNIEGPSLWNANHDDNTEGVISEVSTSDSQIPGVLEAFPGEKFDSELAFDERDVALPGFGVPNEESGSDRVQSFIYHETLKSSIVGLNGLSAQTHETLSLASEGPGNVHFHAETLHATAELLAEVDLLLIYVHYSEKKLLNNLRYF